MTGGIATYKAIELLRLLKKDGADVTVVMTENAKRFVGPATFQALSGRPVADNLWAWRPGMPIEHLALAHAADLVGRRPRHREHAGEDGRRHRRRPARDAPARRDRPGAGRTGDEHQVRILHPATQANLATLAARGVHVVPAESGALAAEEAGYGRLAAIETIHERVRTLLLAARDLVGRHLLVTAGPTREPLDPVRFFSNRSSGKMGLAVAAAARDRGATVTLVAGPIALPSQAGVDVVAVVTAEQMRHAVLAHVDAADAVVMAVAVADYPGRARRTGEDQEGRQRQPRRRTGADGRHPRRTRRPPAARRFSSVSRPRRATRQRQPAASLQRKTSTSWSPTT